MKIKQPELFSVLTAFTPIASTSLIKGGTPVFFISNVLIAQTPEITIQTPFIYPSEFENQGVFFNSFISAVACFSETSILELFFEKNQLCIKSKGRKVYLALITDYPQLPFIQTQKVKRKKLPPSFSTGLDFVSPICSSLTTFPDFNCIHFDKDRLSAINHDTVGTFIFDIDFQSSFNVAKDFLSLLSVFDLHTYALTKTHIYFTSKTNTLYILPKVELEFPAIDSFLTKKGKPIVFSKALFQSITNAGLFTSNDDNTQIQIVVNKNTITIISENNNGKYEDKIRHKTEMKEDSFSFSISQKRLLYILQKTDTGILTSNSIIFKTSEFIFAISIEKNS